MDETKLDVRSLYHQYGKLVQDAISSAPDLFKPQKRRSSGENPLYSFPPYWLPLLPFWSLLDW